jgi:hypothetical protein
MAVDPHTNKSLRVRIKNIKSGRYLSIEGDQNNWNNDDASLTINDWLGIDVLSSPQVWTILQYRANSYILINQFSGYLASIRGRSKDNGATVTQYHCQLPISEPFQQWTFKKLENGNYLIQNVNSSKYIGPHNRDTGNGTYCIQWDDQTGEDSYQEWVFEEI